MCKWLMMMPQERGTGFCDVKTAASVIRGAANPADVGDCGLYVLIVCDWKVVHGGKKQSYETDC